ncbi:MAG TPA: amidohydrolase family protein [Streptosporangiaceae bacterium]
MTSRILLRGGLVADGVGSTTRLADVLIDGPLIASIDQRAPVPVGAPGPAPASSDPAVPADCEVIDLAPGSVVCPGFIDAHAHAEGQLLADGRVDGALAQGVTTLVVGQDGESWIGATAATARYLSRYFAPVNGALDPVRDLSVAAYAAEVSGRLTQNVAVLASQGTIRHNIAGMKPGPLDPGERAAARRQLEDALADGAVGLSSGLDYLPSRLGSIAEVADLARPLAAADRPYVSHLRGYGPDVRAGLDELTAVGHQAGVRVHASHLWGRPADIEAGFGSAEAAGVAITCDMYPYRKSSTIVAALLFPAELQAAGLEHTLAALADPGSRAELLAGPKLAGDYLRNVSLGCLPAGSAQFAGLTITEAARRSGQPAGEWLLDLLTSADLNVGGHLDRPELTDADLVWVTSDHRHCAGSDGIYMGQHPHPRGYGAFARLAGQYAADGSGAGYQRLARHCAANAADAYGLSDRGRLAPGLAADICVIEPGGMTAHASYDTPRELATGVTLVIVNGTIVRRPGHPPPTRRPGQPVT